MSRDLLELTNGRQVVVCVGSGGVGKTTMAAALGLQAAMAGRKTLVLTIDPAKRLANSLGIARLDNVERRIEPEVFRKAGLVPKGELWGMMLDVKRTFDELIMRIAPSEEAAEKILNNHYYQNLSDALAGSQEYMAMEKLHELAADQKYDLLVVDTPPSKHALDFLDAPNRMSDFLDGKVIQWFIKPYLKAGKMGFAFAQRGASIVFKLLERATGYEAMADLAEFFLAFDGMYDGFKRRAQLVRRLLASDKTLFVLVASPAGQSLNEASVFYSRLIREHMPLQAIIFNRVHQWFAEGEEWIDKAEKANQRLINKYPKYAPAIDALLDNAIVMARLARMDQQAVAKYLARVNNQVQTYQVPAFSQDIHDLTGLAKVGEYLRSGS